jgi:hypothetical protein
MKVQDFRFFCGLAAHRVLRFLQDKKGESIYEVQNMVAMVILAL